MIARIRQNADGSAAGLIRMIEVFTAVAGLESNLARRGTLRRHADLVLSDGRHDIGTAADIGDLESRHSHFVAMQTIDPISMLEQGVA